MFYATTNFGNSPGLGRTQVKNTVSIQDVTRKNLNNKKSCETS